jgi:hypothetical protein
MGWDERQGWEKAAARAALESGLCHPNKSSREKPLDGAAVHGMTDLNSFGLKVVAAPARLMPLLVESSATKPEKVEIHRVRALHC